jgi:D-alanyl-D-alanine carboxypeptidase
MKNKKAVSLVPIVIVLVAIAGAAAVWHSRQPTKPAAANAKNSVPSPPGAVASPGFNKTQYSLTDPDSPWIIANKQHKLPAGYVPKGLSVPNVGVAYSRANDSSRLQAPAAAALEKLVAGAKTAGFDIILVSGYRSYATQASLYSGYVKSMGQAEADRSSARPGFSEHQTGLAADIGRADRKCDIAACFGTTPEGQWVRAHAYEYGFVIRYPDGKEPVTGYEYEPWHLRYVGTELAAQLQQSGQTLEEFFAVPGGGY